MSDLLATLASAFRRKGADRLTRHEFKHVLSLDLRWFSPADAKKLLEHALSLGLLRMDGENVEPAFDASRVEVSITFRPTLAILEERPAAPPPSPAPAAGNLAPSGEDLETQVVAAIDAATGAGAEGARREVDQAAKRHEGILNRDVAALLVAARRGVDVQPFIPGAYARLQSENEEGP